MPDAAVVRIVDDILAGKAETDRLADARFDDPAIEALSATTRDGLDRIVATSAVTLRVGKRRRWSIRPPA